MEDSRIVARHPSNATQPSHAQASRNFFDQYFWNDGMVRVSGREYNGLIESPCYQRGELSCLSCHSMHDSDPNDQIKAGMQGNDACTQCHEEIASNLSSHTHHADNSVGSSCYNCHMPHTTYGLLKVIRSHEIESPNVSTAIKTGRAHACNLCHLDKTLAWTSDYMNQWYGHAKPLLTQEQNQVSSTLLHLLSGDAGQRAIAAWHTGWEPALEASGRDWIAPFVAELLSDPYPVVRFIAIRSLRKLPRYEDFEFNYTAPQQSLREAVETAKRLWQTSAESSLASPTILIDERRELMHEQVRKLKSNRNDRPVDLLE